MRKGLGVLLACAACKDPTEIKVDISTDVPCGSLGEVAITVGPTATETETRAPNTTTTMCDPTGTIGTIVILPSGGIDDHLAIQVTARVKQPGGGATGPCVAPFGPSCIVARRELGFVPHTPLLLPIHLDGSCTGLLCKPDETCDRGACVPVTACDSSGCTPDGGAPVVVQGCGDMRGLQANAAWPMLSYCPARIGRSPFNGPHGPSPQSISVPLNVGVLGSPVIGADGTVYVAGDTALVALTPDLKTIWSHPLTGSSASKQTDTSPVIAADGTVWIGTASAQLYAVTAQGATAHDVGFFFGTPVIDPDGIIVFPADKGYSLRGIDATGAHVFDIPVKTPSLHTAPARGWDGSFYIGTDNSHFATAHPPSTYSEADLAPAFDFETPLVHPSGFVVATVADATTESVAVFDSTGAITWKQTLTGSPRRSNGSAVLPDGRVVVSTADGFAIVDVGTRAVQSFPALDTDTSGTRTPSLGADGTIYIAKGPTVYGLDPTGKVLFAFKAAIPSTFESSPAISKDGWSYFTDSVGQIHALHD